MFDIPQWDDIAAGVTVRYKAGVVRVVTVRAATIGRGV